MNIPIRNRKAMQRFNKGAEGIYRGWEGGIAPGFTATALLLPGIKSSPLWVFPLSLSFCLSHRISQTHWLRYLYHSQKNYKARAGSLTWQVTIDSSQPPIEPFRSIKEIVIWRSDLSWHVFYTKLHDSDCVTQLKLKIKNSWKSSGDGLSYGLIEALNRRVFRFHPLLYTFDPRWDRGIKKPNRLLGYDLNIIVFLILLELQIDSRYHKAG